ncbi:hypothetical protein [Rhizobium sp. 768_B6_N1_8]|uniref:hypothetical protein n=1 Tax=unclassified Rhizobium TaxID=2613769 RepID=UPI003F2245DB
MKRRHLLNFALIGLFAGEVAAQEQGHFYWRNVAIGAKAEQVANLELPIYVFAGRSMADEAVVLPEVCSLAVLNASIYDADEESAKSVLLDVAAKTKAKVIVVSGIDIGDSLNGTPVVSVGDSSSSDLAQSIAEKVRGQIKCAAP